MLEVELGDSVVFTEGVIGSVEGVTVHQGVVWNHGADTVKDNTREGIIFSHGIALYTGDVYLGERHVKEVYRFDNGDVEEYIHWNDTTEYLKDVADVCDVIASGLNDETIISETLKSQVIHLTELNTTVNEYSSIGEDEMSNKTNVTTEQVMAYLSVCMMFSDTSMEKDFTDHLTETYGADEAKDTIENIRTVFNEGVHAMMPFIDKLTEKESADKEVPNVYLLLNGQPVTWTFESEGVFTTPTHNGKVSLMDKCTKAIYSEENGFWTQVPIVNRNIVCIPRYVKVTDDHGSKGIVTLKHDYEQTFVKVGNSFDTGGAMVTEALILKTEVTVVGTNYYLLYPYGIAVAKKVVGGKPVEHMYSTLAMGCGVATANWIKQNWDITVTEDLAQLAKTLKCVEDGIVSDKYAHNLAEELTVRLKK